MGYTTDKVFLVTGASSGIGEAIAVALGEAGAKVGLMARSEDKLRALAARFGDNALVVTGDVTSRADCERAVAQTRAAFGRLDGLVHSAGISQRGAVADTDPDVLRRIMDTNYSSTLYLVHAALPHLTATRGHVVVISSVVGKMAPPMRAGYAASKHAVQGYLSALRVEQHDAGVHVLAVCPGFVATNISLNALSPDGSAYGRMDPETAGGLTSERVARDVLAAIAARKREIAPAGLLEAVGVVLSKLAPRLLDRVLLARVRKVRAQQPVVAAERPTATPRV